VQLSILLPTNRDGPVAISRIAQVCSWAGPNIEVIVRDNSGNADKRALLAHFRREHCTIISAAPCEPLENYSEILKLAKGDFIFCLADDDQCFDRAIEALPSMIDQCSKDAAVAGITGAYALEMSQGTSIVEYKDVDSDDAAARVTGFLSYPGPNMLFYSVLRRELAERILVFMKAMPVYLSFHDQVLCLLYLLNGKFVRLPRLFYVYDFGIWEVTESAQKRDADFYKAAGLDLATNKLHWFLCGFEGAVLARNSDIFPDYPIAQRQVIADRWFSEMFIRFKGHARLTFGSRFTGEADKLCEKLLTSTGQLSFQNMLTEICSLIALFSKDNAQRYYDFWDATINRRKAAPRPTSVPAEHSAA
jgi:hypothetical protein